MVAVRIHYRAAACTAHTSRSVTVSTSDPRERAVRCGYARAMPLRCASTVLDSAAP